MILIQSSSDDFSTSMVSQWLCYYNEVFIRLNDNSTITDLNILDNSIKFKINQTTINLNSIKKYWYRRGHFEFQKTKNISLSTIENRINNYNRSENSIIVDTINNYLRFNVENLGSYQTSKINKISTCEVAKKYGFRVPNFLITGSKKELENFQNKYHKIITKSIYGLPGFNLGNIHYSSKTEFVSKNDIDKSQDNFGLSLFQEYIEKKIELRIFFLEDTFFSAAIFSQGDEQTKIDFRNYNRVRPNRVIPYQIPNDIIEKLKKINNELSIKTGSYDLILTPENEYCFLEVNPIGQFAQVSFPCNYYLEKLIAKNLLNE